ncbi:helix-turn-helix transcriptional regulator [Streptomyces sp. NPDC046332]|uniref:helix-turn-helix domain-containing protein n=1 Tax=unclassified Streptomyces TaxID=2593676 RepID=UPI0033D52C6E
MPARRTTLPDEVLERRRILGQRISDHRRAAGLSQDQLADAIGMERRSIQRYERAERDPRFSDLVRIAWALNVPLAVLVE